MKERQNKGGEGKGGGGNKVGEGKTKPVLKVKVKQGKEMRRQCKGGGSRRKLKGSHNEI